MNKYTVWDWLVILMYIGSGFAFIAMNEIQYLGLLAWVFVGIPMIPTKKEAQK